MSAPKVYQIAEFPNDKYRFDIVDNPSCAKTWKQLFEAEQANGAVGIINLGYFGLSGGGYASGCKIHGTWMCNPVYDAYGICIDEDGNAFVGTGKEDNAYSYSEAVPAYTVNGEEMNRDQTWTANGTTTLGFKDGNLVCMLCDKDNGQSTSEQIAAMEEYGCQTILRMDGSWSSHGKLGYGKVVQPSQMRKDRSYMIIYDRNYVAPRTTKKLTLDPYGVTDDENTFAVCDEIKKALEEVEGIECMITRYRDNPDLDNSLRADQSNQWGANLVFGINVSGASTDDIDAVTAAWTNKSTSTAFKFATLIAENVKEAGMKTSDSPAVMSTDPILKETTACAAMVVFVGDYSTEEARKPVVEIAVKSICEQLGVEYIEINTEPEEPVDPIFKDDPFMMYDKDTNTKFQELKSLGIFSADIQIQEVVRYGDLTNVIYRLIKNESNGGSGTVTDPIEPGTGEITIDEDWLKSFVAEAITEYINENLPSTIDEKVNASLEEKVTAVNSLIDTSIADLKSAASTALSNIDTKYTEIKTDLEDTAASTKEGIKSALTNAANAI